MFKKVSAKTNLLDFATFNNSGLKYFNLTVENRYSAPKM